MTAPVRGEAVSEERLRNVRAWAAARVGSLSGADITVAAIDELLALRLEVPTLKDALQASQLAEQLLRDEVAELRRQVESLMAAKDEALERVLVEPRVDDTLRIEELEREVGELRRRVGEMEANDARYRWIMQRREYEFRDDSGLWVGLWKRAIGDTQGIISAAIDRARAGEGT
jgi:hypothetical protein